MEKLWSKEDWGGEFAKNSQPANAKILIFFFEKQTNFFLKNYIYIYKRKDLFLFKLLCSCFVLFLQGFRTRSYSGVAKFPTLRKFSFAVKFFALLLLTPASPLLQKFYTNCKNKYKKKK